MTELQQKYGPWALIAGATQGIGEQFSHQLAAAGLNIFLLARNATDLARVAREIEQKHKVKTATLATDLANLASPATHSELEAALQTHDIGLLVYNAAYSHIGHFVDDSLSSQFKCLDVNCKGPLTLLDLLTPDMLARGRGGIILMSSMSGFQGTAMVATYAASKAFNTVLAEGLWHELRARGIDVLACVAGATRTPNFERETPADKVRMALPMAPAAVVSEALTALQQQRGPTLICGRTNRLVYTLLQRIFSRRRAVSFMSNATQKIYADNTGSGND